MIYNYRYSDIPRLLYENFLVMSSIVLERELKDIYSLTNL